MVLLCGTAINSSLCAISPVTWMSAACGVWQCNVILQYAVVSVSDQVLKLSVETSLSSLPITSLTNKAGHLGHIDRDKDKTIDNSFIFFYLETAVPSTLNLRPSALLYLGLCSPVRCDWCGLIGWLTVYIQEAVAWAGKMQPLHELCIMCSFLALMLWIHK